MTNKFDKPFVDYPELVTNLHKRGLKIQDVSVATDLLRTYGYYPLINGFKKTFLLNTDEELYHSDASLEQIFAQFVIDFQFQELFLTSVLQIENHFKNAIGYSVAKAFGVNDHTSDDENNPDPSVQSYLRPDLYRNSGSAKVNSTIRFIRQKVLTSEDNPVAYYRESKNHIPPWILMDNMMLGTAIKYFQILPSNLKNEVCNELVDSFEDENMDQKKALILSTLEILRQFRNAAAHSAPMYLQRVSQDNDPSLNSLTAYLGEEISNNSERSKGIGTKNLYAALISLIFLNRNLGSRTNLITKLSALQRQYLQSEDSLLIETYNRYLISAGLPTDYIRRLETANLTLNDNRFEDYRLSVPNTDGSGETYIGNIHLPKNPDYGIAQDKNVFITTSGKKYHKNKLCPVIKGKNFNKISLMSAIQSGHTPCSRCK